jgi:hypothetical protein
MLPDPIALRISHDRSCDFFSAPATKTLILLQRSAAFVAEHDFLPAELPLLHEIRAIAHHRSNKHVIRGEGFVSNRTMSAGEGIRLPQSSGPKTKRPPGNLGSLFFQGRIVLTEIKPSKLSGEIL